MTCSRSYSWWWQSWEGWAGPPTHGPCRRGSTGALTSQGEGRAPAGEAVSGESLPVVMGRAPQAGPLCEQTPYGGREGSGNFGSAPFT